MRDLQLAPRLDDERGPAVGTSLHVTDTTSSRVIPLPPGACRVGTSPGADVRVIDEGAAPLHLAIAIRDGALTIADLGAAPTTLNGAPFTGLRTLAPGDVIGLGATTITLQRAALPRPLATLATLRRRLDEAVRRAREGSRLLALLAIDLGAPLPDLDAVAGAVSGMLRGDDLIGWDAGTLLVLLEGAAERATVPATRLLRAVSPLAPRARAGFAVFPSDGADSAALLRLARASARAAPTGGTAPAGDFALRVGEHHVIATDPAITRVFALVERLAASDLPVLVRGETGAGKEVVAAALHGWSPRAARRMVSINCAALPDTLLESELFGHEKGAFSDATSAKPGLLESAAGGTVFLDEMGELSAAAQAKLLRVLETRRVSRLGALIERTIDVRVVAATNRALDEEVARGRFRSDLYFRIGAATITLPPLRDRPHDLPLLARAFLADTCARLGRPTLVLAPDALEALARHDWPGNLRELRNAMGFVAATVEGAGPVGAAALPDPLRDDAAGGALASVTPLRFRSLYDEIRDLERARILAALDATGGVRVRAAALIGMPLRTFVSKLREHGIAAPSPRRGRVE